MAVSDKKLVPAVLNSASKVLDGAAAVKVIPFHVSAVAISQAAVVQGKRLIPFGYEIVDVTAWARGIAATAQVDVQIGAVSVLTGLLTPTSGGTNPGRGTLVSTRATRRGAAGSVISVLATTNGTGTLTEVTVVVTIRPYPLNGEV